MREPTSTEIREAARLVYSGQVKHGGKRSGAGRKKLPVKQKKRGISMMLKPHTIQQIKNIYGSVANYAAWIDSQFSEEDE